MKPMSWTRHPLFVAVIGLILLGGCQHSDEAPRTEVALEGVTRIAPEGPLVAFVESDTPPPLVFTLTASGETPTPFTADVYAVAAQEQAWLMELNVSALQIRTPQTPEAETRFAVTLTEALQQMLMRHTGVRLRVVKRSQAREASTVAETVLPPIARIRKVLTIGGATINLDEVTYLSAADDACQPVLSSVDAVVAQGIFDAVGTWAPTATHSSAPVTFSQACFTLAYDVQSGVYVPTLKAGEGRIDTVVSNNQTVQTGTLQPIDSVSPVYQLDPSVLNPTYMTLTTRPLDITVALSAIDASGNVAIGDVNVTLPRGHSFHREVSGKITPRGSKRARFTVLFGTKALGGDWSSWDLVPAEPTWLHAPGLPFSIRLSNRLHWDGARLSDTQATARYVHADLSDVVSNDVKFDKETTDFPFSLDKDGIDSAAIPFQNTTFVLNAAPPQTHFPRLTLTTDKDFTVRLENSALVPTAIADETLTLEYSAKCAANGCAATGNTARQTKTLAPPLMHLAADGAMAGIVTAVGPIAWGIRQNDRSVFERDDRVSGMLYIPGFQIPADRPETVAAQLQGSRAIAQGMLFGDLYAANTGEAAEGDHYFAGLTIGPEALVGASGSVDPGAFGTLLGGTTMQVALGGDFTQPLTLQSNDGSKYLLRPSGVTGVFNSDDSDTRTVYGYPMQFKRFAFSQVSNVLDEESWIDGVVEVGGNGGFGIDFTSLAMDCRGALSGGNVAPADCQNGLNCNLALSAWKMPMDPVAIAFAPTTADQCNPQRTLEVSSVLNVRALKERLGLKATWRSDGTAADAVITGRTENLLDVNASGAGHRVALSGQSSLEANADQAWFQSAVDVALPFWERMPATLRAVNHSLAARAPSLLAAPKDFAQLDMHRTNTDLNQQIASREYNLSAVYAWGSTGIALGFPVYYDTGTSRFLGRELAYDLKVLSAKAGVNYITPTDTKVSFGASADFTAIKEMKLHVDLNDPKSLREIDGILDTIGIGGDPLQNSVGQVVQKLNFANALADKGLTLAMEQGAIFALKQLPSESDPFLAVARVGTQSHALPAVITDTVTSAIVSTLYRPALTTFQKLDQQSCSAAVIAQLPHDLSTIQGGITQVEATTTFLSEMQKVLKTTAEVTAAIKDINKTVASFFIADEESADGGTKCSLDRIHPDGFLKPVGDTVKTMNEVNKKIKAIDVAGIAKLAEGASKFIKLDSKEVKDAIRKLAKFATFLQTEVDKSTTNFKGFFEKDLCPHIGTIQTAMQPIYDISAKVTPVITFLTARVTTLQTQLDASKDQSVGQQIALLKKAVTGAQAALGRGVDCNTSLTAQLFDDYDRTLQQLREIGTLTQTELKKFDSQPNLFHAVPNTGADGYRKMVVVAMLNTPPMAAMRKAANTLISPVTDAINQVAVKMFSVINTVVNGTLASISTGINDSLQAASGAVKQLPIDAAKMDGYALISGDELERLHIDASWSIGPKDKKSKQTAYSFSGAFDMARWSANGKAGCGDDTSYDANVDVTIGTRNIGLKLGKKEFMIDELGFGFTLQAVIPVGVYGGITSKKGFDFEKFKLYDMGLFAGVGALETYLGAKTAATFDRYQLQAAFLFGQTCGRTVITKLDPEVGKFITLPGNRFNGIYLRGGATFPIYNAGCALTVGVGANLGVWYLVGPPQTYGGLIGGEAYGQAACIAALKGQVKALFEKSGEQVKFIGSGWGAAGLGQCEPATWKSVPLVRKDDWCGTGDAAFSVEYKDDAWKVGDVAASAID